jgi:hypothetical protein
MKKILLLFLLIFIQQQGKGQSLVGTQWLGTNAPSPNIWLNFETDTVYYSFIGSGFLPMSLYTASSGNFEIMDISGTAVCMDTGYYNYNYTGSTLAFSVINDACTNRRNTLVNYNWILLGTTGVSESLAEKKISIFPNPSANGIFQIKNVSNQQSAFEIVINDLNGKIVFSKQEIEGETILDLSALPQGIYVCVIDMQGTMITLKLAK